MQSIAKTVEQIQDKAREFNMGRFLLVLVSLPFFVLGWVARYGTASVLVVASWVWAAVQVGWKVATEQRKGGS